MLKDFDNWNEVKKKSNYRIDSRLLYFKEKEVWWCRMGVNIGHEQDGKGRFFERPILIVKKFNRRVFLGVPLTTKNKHNKYYKAVISLDNIERSVIISQIRLFDINRLSTKMFVLQTIDFLEIKKAIRELFS